MTHRILLSFWLLCLFHTGYGQRDTVWLNKDWRFCADRNMEGFAQRWSQDGIPGARLVNLPHTWNVEPGTETHYGWGWYQQELFVPRAWKGKRLTLTFGAINHTAIVYLNGKVLTENTGDGYSRFGITLDDRLLYGKSNRITIAVSNSWSGNKVPFGSSFDWPNDGGLIRKACLVLSDRPAADWLKASASLSADLRQGDLELRVGVAATTRKDLRFGVLITEENQPSRDTVYAGTLTPEWSGKEGVLRLHLPRVNPWHFDSPNLYKVTVSLHRGNAVTDRVTTQVGFRQFLFRNGQTFLNGERVKLVGVEWTAGSHPDHGFAETDQEILRYCRLMKDVNAVFTRQHFQQDDLFYDFCDRNGILVQQELPLWGPETPVNDTIRRISHSQLERMVLNYGHHPCIFSWGVGNELRGRDQDIREFIGGLLQRCRELDPQRYCVYVSNSLTHGFAGQPGFVPDAAAAGDYLAMNEYGGSWWDLPTGKIGYYLDSVHASYPDKPFFISEFGLCEPNFSGGDKRRTEDLIYHMGIYESKPWVEGAIYFDLTDYRTHYPGTMDTGRFRQRIHGIYDMYGNPKPSMKVLRELFSPLEVHSLRADGKGKLSILLFGNIGLPQYAARGYVLYVSEREDNYAEGVKVALPEILPGQRLSVSATDRFRGGGVVTIVRPNGYVVQQKAFP